MNDEDTYKQLDITVPLSTTLKQNVRNLWLMVETEEQAELEECTKLASQLEEKLRRIARSLQDREAKNTTLTD